VEPADAFAGVLVGCRVADLWHADSIRKNQFVTTRKTVGPAEATPAARMLASYRTRLAELLARAETAGQNGNPDIHLAVGALVERLSFDLIQLYDHSERGLLAESDRITVVPALELMREILRHAHRRPRSLRDTLHMALAPIPGNPP
jgi:hypothetical protein